MKEIEDLAVRCMNEKSGLAWTVAACLCDELKRAAKAKDVRDMRRVLSEMEQQFAAIELRSPIDELKAWITQHLNKLSWYRNNLTQSQIAAQAGVSQAVISQFESGLFPARDYVFLNVVNAYIKADKSRKTFVEKPVSKEITFVKLQPTEDRPWLYSYEEAKLATDPRRTDLPSYVLEQYPPSDSGRARPGGLANNPLTSDPEGACPSCGIMHSLKASPYVCCMCEWTGTYDPETKLWRVQEF